MKIPLELDRKNIFADHFKINKFFCRGTLIKTIVVFGKSPSLNAMRKEKLY